jgi:hypothetical protein
MRDKGGEYEDICYEVLYPSRDDLPAIVCRLPAFNLLLGDGESDPAGDNSL